MNSKFGDWAIRIFAILYGCICIGLIIYDCTMNKQPQKEKECILNIVFENQTSYKDITICMIEKIKQDGNPDVLDDYIYNKENKLSKRKFKELMNADFYIEKNENIALGLFHPNVKLSYKDELKNEYSIVYSFLNAEVRFYLNDKIHKVMLMYNPNKLSELLYNL